jgi:hypothetical protein
MKNEKGYALVLVLLIITITFTFALSLSGMALSARKQFNKTDEINRATDLAEMGVAHYETLVRRYIDEANNEAKKTIQDVITQNQNKNDNQKQPIPDYDELFKSALRNKLISNSSLDKQVEATNKYLVIYQAPIKEISGKLTVLFTSEGITRDSSKTLYSSINLVKTNSGSSRTGETLPGKEGYEKFISYPIDTNKSLPFPTSTFFNESIKIRGKKSIDVYGNAFFNRVIELNGNAKLNIIGDTVFDDIITINGSSDITVYGDAIFKRKLSETEKSYTFCITGNVYLIDNNKLIEYVNFPAGKNASCQKSNDSEWSIDPNNGIEVKY